MGKPRRNKSHSYRECQSRLCRLDLLPLTFGSRNDVHVADRWVCWAYKIPHPFPRGVNSDELPGIIPRAKCTIDLKITVFANAATTTDRNDGRKTSRGFRYGSSLSAKPHPCGVFASRVMCAKQQSREDVSAITNVSSLKRGLQDLREIKKTTEITQRVSYAEIYRLAFLSTIFRVQKLAFVLYSFSSRRYAIRFGGSRPPGQEVRGRFGRRSRYTTPTPKRT